MMTQELNVCVLAAPLAAIDRRELSQAWYSALRCAPSDKEQAQAPAKRNEPFRVRRQNLPLETDVPSRKRTPERFESVARAARRSEGDRSAIALTERRTRSPLARSIERTLLERRPAPRRATLTAEGKRVHVMVHASEGLVRLVAVCPPSIREVVARALAQARFALASRGVACS